MDQLNDEMTEAHESLAETIDVGIGPAKWRIGTNSRRPHWDRMSQLTVCFVEDNLGTVEGIEPGPLQTIVDEQGKRRPPHIYDFPELGCLSPDELERKAAELEAVRRYREAAASLQKEVESLEDAKAEQSSIDILKPGATSMLADLSIEVAAKEPVLARLKALCAELRTDAEKAVDELVRTEQQRVQRELMARRELLYEELTRAAAPILGQLAWNRQALSRCKDSLITPRLEIP